MEYNGSYKGVRVMIANATNCSWLSNYVGQECDAIFYDKNTKPQINSEQLSPPIPKWQSVPLDCLSII